jgi:integrase
MIRNYSDGEKTCPICGKPLPAHETWPGARYRFCDSVECRGVVKFSSTGRYIGPNEHRCEGPDCDNFVPAGRYDVRADYVTCCGECWIRRRTKGNRLLTCGCGCDEQFLGRAERRPIDGLYFMDSKHFGVYLHNKYLDKNCGALRPIADEFLGGFAKLHYRELQTLRSAIGPFFLFLKELGIISLDDITPQTITQFITWGVQAEKSVLRTISYISTFFKWAITSGYCTKVNPVIPLIHRARGQKRLPRPLSDQEVEFTWQLLHERGNARLKLATAIALEAGLRIGEICRLRLQDVNLEKQTLFIGLPNKASRERTAFFSDKTLKYYQEWIAERDPNCGHDRLLHNTRGNPCAGASLGAEFNRVLCKCSLGQKLHDTGFDKWRTHRLRHTMATNLAAGGADAATVMAAGGWATYEAMTNYAEVNNTVARRGYEEATARARKLKLAPALTKTLSIEEFLDRKNKCA